MLPYSPDVWCLTAVLVAAHGSLLLAAGPAEPRDDLPATYVNEAPLPEGFPPPGEVGEVIEKSYPVIRSFSARGEGAFMKNFGYLSRQKHRMTAPVIMEASDAEQAEDQQQIDSRRLYRERMHFLLENNSLDEPKVEGPVTVGDLPAMRVLSIAHQGEMTQQAFEAAEAQLHAALAERDDLQIAGPPRLLGYNGPAVRRDRGYWEVQIPVEPRGE